MQKFTYSIFNWIEFCTSSSSTHLMDLSTQIIAGATAQFIGESLDKFVVFYFVSSKKMLKQNYLIFETVTIYIMKFFKA